MNLFGGNADFFVQSLSMLLTNLFEDVSFYFWIDDHILAIFNFDYYKGI